MDLPTALTVFAITPLIEKLFGPTVEYFGDALKTFTEKKIKNVKCIIDASTKLLGKQLDSPGQIHPKIIHQLFTEGAFIEDELVREYFAGILASSRTANKSDDMGSYYLSILSRLSIYQIRAHYIIYSSIKKLFNGLNINPALGQYRESLCRTFIPYDEYYESMNFMAAEESENAMQHIFDGLSIENLIELDWISGDLSFEFPENNKTLESYGGDYVERVGNSLVYGKGICLFPAGLGFELYYRAHGMVGKNVEDFFKKEIVFAGRKDIHIPSNCKHVPIMLKMDIDNDSMRSS